MAAFDFPNAPVVDQVYVANGVSYKWDGQAWVGGPALDNTHVLRAGDTMTGNLVIDPLGVNAAVTLDKSASGLANLVTGNKNGQLRWNLAVGDANPESSGNAGSDFTVYRYTDAGVYLDAPFAIGRSTATAVFGGVISVTGAANAGNPSIQLNKLSSGKQAAVTGMMGGASRWTILLGDTTAESAGAGSNFGIYRHNDAGTTIEAVFSSYRASGKISTPQSFAACGAAFPAAGATAESGPTLFSPYITCSSTLGLNAYVRAGPPAAWSSWQGGAGGYVSVDASANMTLGAGVNPGVGQPLNILPRFIGYAAGYTYVPSRHVATDAIGVAASVTMSVYSTALASCMGFVHSSQSNLSCYAMDGVGNPTASPLYTVNRAGLVNIGSSAAMAFYDSGGGANIFLQFNGNSYIQYVPSTGRSYFIQAGGTPMNLPANGNLEVAGGAPFKPAGGPWSATSDERVKQDIRPYEAGLDEILALQPKWYQYRPETHMTIVGEDKVGLIAQEVKTVMPECVTVGPREEGEFSFEDMHTFDSGPILYALINAVKTLEARVRELEAAR